MAVLMQVVKDAQTMIVGLSSSRHQFPESNAILPPLLCSSIKHGGDGGREEAEAEAEKEAMLSGSDGDEQGECVVRQEL